MDGVLSDLDGALRKFAPEIFPDLRSQVHLQRVQALGAHRAFQSLDPLRLSEMRGLMNRLHKGGHNLEILSSLGVSGEIQDRVEYQVGATSGKLHWLKDHYGDFLENGVISRVNLVSNCEQKAYFADLGSVLVDDQAGNVNGFASAGGFAHLYKTTYHEGLVSFLDNLRLI